MEIVMNKVHKIDSSKLPKPARAPGGPATAGVDFDMAIGGGVGGFSVMPASTGGRMNLVSTQVAEVTITSAQMKALKATPVTLVAAPGAGLVLEFVQAMLFLDYGSNALVEGTYNSVIRYKDGSGVIASQAIESTGFIDQTADTMSSAIPKIDVIGAKSAIENQPLLWHNSGAGEWTGNAAGDTVMRIKVQYNVYKTGF